MLDDPIQTDGMISAILPFLNCENEVVRSAAVRALGVHPGSPDVRGALLGLLRDEDPDVRSDAIEALMPLAQPEDADAIQASLTGDPVREVKLAAISILAQLNDRSSVDLLRALVLDKCEDRVAWEDDLGDWDDWLDVQIAAIDALGTMGAEDSIEDMLAALDDEMGQTLDVPVFRALSNMGREGVIWLLSTIQTASGLTRKRAAEAIALSNPDVLTDFREELIGSDDPSLRILVLPLLSEDDPEAARLTQDDPSDMVRIAGLHKFAECRPECVLNALLDESESVRAEALGLLALPVDEDMHEILVDNCLAWSNTAGPALSMATVTLLPRLAHNRAIGPLINISVNSDRPLEVRIAATRALTPIQTDQITHHLTALLSDRAQQLRLIALRALRERVDEGDTIALDILTRAIDQTLLSDEDSYQPLNTKTAADVATPKGGRGSNIHISEDGEIIRDAEPGEAPQSTLASLQTIDGATDQPEMTSSQKRKRVAVEGSDAVAEDLARAAMDVCRDLGSVRIASAAIGHLTSESETLRLSAWRLIASSFSTSIEARGAISKATDDTLPEIRLLAYSVFAEMPAELIGKALSDSDAMIRAHAIGALQSADTLRYLDDLSAIVREAALRQVLASDDADLIDAAAAKLLKAEKVATLAIGLTSSSQIWQKTAAVLSEAPDRQAFVILEALTKTGQVAGQTA